MFRKNSWKVLNTELIKYCFKYEDQFNGAVCYLFSFSLYVPPVINFDEFFYPEFVGMFMPPASLIKTVLVQFGMKTNVLWKTLESAHNHSIELYLLTVIYSA